MPETIVSLAGQHLLQKISEVVNMLEDLPNEVADFIDELKIFQDFINEERPNNSRGNQHVTWDRPRMDPLWLEWEDRGKLLLHHGSLTHSDTCGNGRSRVHEQGFAYALKD
ncbi:hypothetical protein Fmac_024935 [Flemingia macrophylla]|uniref:Uncharacterized protein n=1 Tax=Flemingia macrophylla TaxID=520843 RepID=A0ABD1LQS4_9FABA